MASETPRPVAPERPNGFDFFVMLLGFSVSLLLLQLRLPVVVPRDPADALVNQSLLPWLKMTMRLSEGVVLMWPILFTAQRVLGRTQKITVVEWLWIGSWLCVATFNVFALVVGLLPEDALRNNLDALAYWPSFAWYLVVEPLVALAALLLGLLAAVRRTPVPWTHSFGVVLLIWPVLPAFLALIVLGRLATP